MHQETADLINKVVQGLDIDRKAGKETNFSVVYGMGPDSFAYKLNSAMKVLVRKGEMTEEEYQKKKKSVREAEQIIDGYFKAYPGYAAWKDKEVNKAKKYGRVRTFTGRMRPIPEFKSKKGYGAAVRKVVNSKIQGGAGDLMKLEISRLYQLFQENPHWDAHLLMIVHDEFVIEAKLEYIHEAKTAVKESMETVWPSCTVPIKADIDAFWNWGGMKGGSSQIPEFENSFLSQLTEGFWGDLV